MLKKTSLVALLATVSFVTVSSVAFAEDTNDTTTSTATQKSSDKKTLKKWRDQVEVWETTILRIHEAKKEFIGQVRKEFEVASQAVGLTLRERKALKVAYAKEVAALHKSAQWFIASLGPRPVKPVAAK